MLLSEAPKIRLIKHNTGADSFFTVRELDKVTDKRICELRCTTPKGKELYDKYLYYHSVENKLKEYTDLWYKKTNQPIPTILPEKIMQYKTYDYSNLIPRSINNWNARPED